MENNTLIQNAKGLAVRYAEFTGYSVKIEMDIWKYRSVVGENCSVEWRLSAVGGVHPNLTCKLEKFKTFTDLHDFVIGQIKKKEILFRKFS